MLENLSLKPNALVNIFLFDMNIKRIFPLIVGGSQSSSDCKDWISSYEHKFEIISLIFSKIILGKLTLQIPWTNIYTSSTKFTIDGFYMVLIPKIEVEYDAIQDEHDQHKNKMQEVEKLEKLHKEKENLGKKFN